MSANRLIGPFDTNPASQALVQSTQNIDIKEEDIGWEKIDI